MCAMTVAARSSAWYPAEVLVLRNPQEPDVFLEWDWMHQAFRATWGCGSVAARDVAAVVDADA
jgi:hypothetical protein